MAMAETRERSRYVEIAKYEPVDAMRLLVYAPLWDEVKQAFGKPSFADGGNIQRRAVPTEANFCVPASHYGDLRRAGHRVPLVARIAGNLYWWNGWHYREVRRIFEIRDGATLELIHEYTERVLEIMTRRDQGAYYKLWREGQNMENRGSLDVR